MANLINEAKRFQKLAGIITESQILSEAVKLDVLMKDGKPNSEILVVPNKFYSDKEELDANTMRPFQIKKEEGHKDMMVFTVVGRKAENQQFPIEGDEVADIILYNDAKSGYSSELNEEKITMDYYDKEKKAMVPGNFNLTKIKFGNIDTGIPEKNWMDDGTLPAFISTDQPCERCSRMEKNKLAIGVFVDKEGNIINKGGVLNGMWLPDFDSSSAENTKAILSSIKDLSGLKKYVKDEFNKANLSQPQPQAESLDIDSIVNEALKSVRK
jgi:hypothetical protein